MKIIYLLIIFVWLASLSLIYDHGKKNIEHLLITSVENNEREITQLLDIAIAYNNSIKEQLISNLNLKQHLGKNPLLTGVKNYPDINSYGLDMDSPLYQAFYNANLTGKGRVEELTPDILSEINAVLWLNFSAPVESVDGQFKWSYYTSVNGFMALAPKLHISRFHFSDFYYTRPFWHVALPENNPEKRTVFSDLFEDSAAPGQIVSISTPVYYENKFRGVVTLDVALDYLNNVLRSNVSSAHDNLSLITKDGQVVTTNNLQLPERIDFKITNETPFNQLVSHLDFYYILSHAINDKFYVVYQLSPTDLRRLIFENIYDLIAISLLLLIVLLMLAKMLTLYRKTKKLAEFDGLSNLYNRMTLEHLSEQVLEDSLNRGQPVCIIMADIDFFKKINDEYGHHVGDKGIIHVANIIKDIVRKTDLAGRYGGEEFVITVPNCNIEKATEFAERIRTEVENSTFHKNKNIKLSLGIAETSPTKMLSFKELCKKADLALYKAKEDGRNCTVQYSPDLEKFNKRTS